MYRMGRNAIDRGSRDTWTVSPHRMAVAGGAAGAPSRLDRDKLRDPRLRDPRGYILPAGQPDFATATKFVNALILNGVEVRRASAPFVVNAVSYPAGSFVVRTDQAFRPHVLDMFEPQDHPDDVPYPGAPPTPPYDSAGWTLAFQMGVRFDRVLDALRRPLRRGLDGRRAACRASRRARQCRRLRDRAPAERCGHRREPTAQGGRGCVLAARTGDRRLGAARDGHDLRGGQTVDVADPAGSRVGVGLDDQRCASSADRQCDEASTRADRIVGPLRGLGRERLDPVAARTLSSFHSMSSTRRRSTPETSARSTTC